MCKGMQTCNPIAAAAALKLQECKHVAGKYALTQHFMCSLQAEQLLTKASIHQQEHAMLDSVQSHQLEPTLVVMLSTPNINALQPSMLQH
jgi:hypothetical protein